MLYSQQKYQQAINSLEQKKKRQVKRQTVKPPEFKYDMVNEENGDWSVQWDKALVQLYTQLNGNWE